MHLATSEIPEIDHTFPEVSFKIAGVTYSLRYDFEAIGIFQHATGINLIADRFELNALNLIALLNAGLHRFHPEIEFKQIEGWINVKSAQALWQLALQGLKESLPEPKAIETESPDADPPSA